MNAEIADVIGKALTLDEEGNLPEAYGHYVSCIHKIGEELKPYASLGEDNHKKMAKQLFSLAQHCVERASATLERHWEGGNDKEHVCNIDADTQSSVVKVPTSVDDGVEESTLSSLEMELVETKGKLLKLRKEASLFEITLRGLGCDTEELLDTFNADSRETRGNGADGADVNETEENRLARINSSPIMIRAQQTNQSIIRQMHKKQYLSPEMKLRYLRECVENVAVARDKIVDDRVDHLILVVHGIGNQDMVESAKSGKLLDGILHSVEQLRKNCDVLLKSHFDGFEDKICFQHIEWHSVIRSLPNVESVLRRVTLGNGENLNKLRGTLNDTFLDILYFMSKNIGQIIIDEVTSQLNQAYTRFCESHPNFSGKVSLFGHSLGSVISFEVMRHQNVDESFYKINQRNNYANIHYPQLCFSVQNLFACGSPLAVFALVQGNAFDVLCAFCQRYRLFNIFHPFDAIAYRIEPILEPRVRRDAVELQHWRTGNKRLHLKLASMLGDKGRILGSKADKDDVSSVLDSGVLNDGNRIDYCLQHTALENMSEVLFTIRAHSVYWGSKDTMLFLLSQITGMSPSMKKKK